ncbi:unnamed protein product [Closterium sp. Naga37s-1]|nr:unnamed protein product [Closterium sp. Naga37s-1]
MQRPPFFPLSPIFSPFPSLPLHRATDPDPPKPWTCDVSSGSWTPSANLPLYTGLTCPYIRSGHNCQSAGRSDMSYQKQRWRPWGCKVVQLTPQRLLTLFRNKTVVVFGDSVSKDLSTSLRCMLHAASPNFSRFKLAGGATRVWGEKVSNREETKMSLFSSHLNHIGFIPDASQPPSLIISFISLSPGSRPHLTTLLTRPYLSSPHSHISHVQVEPQNIRIVSLFSSHLNDIGFIPDASQPPSAAAAAAGVGGVGANGAGAGCDVSASNAAAAASVDRTEEAREEAVRAVATEADIARATTMSATAAAAEAGTAVATGEAGETTAATRAARGAGSGNLPGRVSPQAQQQARRVFLDQIDPKIKDLLPKADIVIFQATNWWYAEDNQWFLGGRQQKITRDAAYAIGLATLRDHVARSGFKGKAVVMGVSPSHYIVPVAGMKKGKCDINTRLDWNQTKELRMDDRSFEMRKVQLQVLKSSLFSPLLVAFLSPSAPPTLIHSNEGSEEDGQPII